MKGVVDIGLKVLFASLFVYFRVYGWFFMSKQVYEDTMFILDAKKITRRVRVSVPEGSGLRRRGHARHVFVAERGVVVADCERGENDLVWWKEEEGQVLIIE